MINVERERTLDYISGAYYGYDTTILVRTIVRVDIFHIIEVFKDSTG